ncbi:hypothetical protein AVEN_137094-1 [Araneus ventricosus]|uniref:Uncharacterized protein n=1 Tax=Araneus ventricosus TaxID=182803 RepID=A0A4Y2PEW6_ARAVE|nr:hypothetical protein AVEN_137094-1 [Araneus ventricosus]
MLKFTTLRSLALSLHHHQHHFLGIRVKRSSNAPVIWPQKMNRLWESSQPIPLYEDIPQHPFLTDASQYLCSAHAPHPHPPWVVPTHLTPSSSIPFAEGSLRPASDGSPIRCYSPGTEKVFSPWPWVAAGGCKVV